jgi:ABC-2 type transport system ATP-binding protein
MENIIEVKNLCKHFRTLNRREGILGAVKDLFSRNFRIVRAVDDITFSIPEGSIVGFLGPNGAGKSTTIKMLTGVLEPTSGSINAIGFTPYKSRRKYVRNIGVVLGQRSQLWWDLPAIESFKLLKEIYRISQKDYEQNMGLFDEIVNLRSLASTPVRNLSLGQRMLCDIAASFLHNPRLIFLDEPTIGLDIAVKSKVRQIIKDLNRIKKSTIIITSHDLGDIESLCRRIILIDKGMIIFDGPIDTILSVFGRYRTLKIDVKGLRDTDKGKVEEIGEGIQAALETKSAPAISEDEAGWLCLTVNQDEVKLLDVLNHVMRNYPVRDVKIEEVDLKDVIKKVYEGGLG